MDPEEETLLGVSNRRSSYVEGPLSLVDGPCFLRVTPGSREVLVGTSVPFFIFYISHPTSSHIVWKAGSSTNLSQLKGRKPRGSSWWASWALKSPYSPTTWFSCRTSRYTFTLLRTLCHLRPKGQFTNKDGWVFPSSPCFNHVVQLQWISTETLKPGIKCN